MGLLIFALLLAQMTLWKESELFWLNIGGYPIWLRDCVRTLYYPYLFFVLTTSAFIFRSLTGRFLRTFRYSRIWLVFLLCLIVIVSCLGLLVANNLINLVESRPLHYHDWENVTND